MIALRVRYKLLNPHYETGWTESWSHRRRLHEHQSLLEAAKCGMPHGAGWYVFAVEGDTPREFVLALGFAPGSRADITTFGDIAFFTNGPLAPKYDDWDSVVLPI